MEKNPSSILFSLVPPLDRLEVLCGERSTAYAVSLALSDLGVLVQRSAEIKLLLDIPPSHALRLLEAMKIPPEKTIVATRNTCPEHSEDLWELGSLALVSISMALARPRGSVLSEIRERIARGERYRLTPDTASRLRSTERIVLRYLARGWEPKQIAERLQLEDQSVRNTACRVRSKLGLSNDARLTMYYWGLGETF